jgi:hypothetical protein
MKPMKVKSQNNKLHRNKLLEKEVTGITYRISYDNTKPSRILCENEKTKKKKLAITVRLHGLKEGDKECTQYITEWKTVQNLLLEVNLDTSIFQLGGTSACWRNIK